MHPWTHQISPDEGREYLADLHALAAELESAMDHIARQELLPLQESIKIQEAVCFRLAHMLRGRSSTLLRSDSLTKSLVDSDLALHIEEATASLVTLNRRYAALLSHSSETLRLFAGLFRSYQQLTQPTSGIQASLPTWSCEV